MYELIDIPLIKAGGVAPRHFEVDTIVVHYTATPGLKPIAVSQSFILKLIDRAYANRGISAVTAALLRSRFSDPMEPITDAVSLCLTNAGNLERTASWHFCVGSARGMVDVVQQVVRYVVPESQAHHVGALGLRTNERSIGIEVCYPGVAPRRTVRTRDEAMTWYENAHWRVRESELVYEKCPDGVKRWCAPISMACWASLEQLVSALCRSFPRINAICSHYLFSPKRRIDPDPPIGLRLLRESVGAIVGRQLFDKPQGKPVPIST